MWLLGFVVKIAGAVTVSYLLFIILPVLHALLGNAVQANTNQLNTRRVVAQIIKKKKKKKKKLKRRIRKVNSAKSRRNNSRFNLKFSPELGSMGGEGVAVAAHEAKAVIFNEGETDESPVPLRITPIPFPPAARAKGIFGNLMIEIVIGRDGRVESVRDIKSPHPSFSAAARRTVRTWKFRPGRNKGIPVRVRARKLIEFKLEE